MIPFMWENKNTNEMLYVHVDFALFPTCAIVPYFNNYTMDKRFMKVINLFIKYGFVELRNIIKIETLKGILRLCRILKFVIRKVGNLIAN